MVSKDKTISELYDILLELVCSPVFSGNVFEKDTETHKNWTIAREILKTTKKTTQMQLKLLKELQNERNSIKKRWG